MWGRPISPSEMGASAYPRRLGRRHPAAAVAVGSVLAGLATVAGALAASPSASVGALYTRLVAELVGVLIAAALATGVAAVFALHDRAWPGGGLVAGVVSITLLAVPWRTQ